MRFQWRPLFLSFHFARSLQNLRSCCQHSLGLDITKATGGPLQCSKWSQLGPSCCLQCSGRKPAWPMPWSPSRPWNHGECISWKHNTSVVSAGNTRSNTWCNREKPPSPNWWPTKRTLEEICCDDTSDSKPQRVCHPHERYAVSVPQWEWEPFWFHLVSYLLQQVLLGWQTGELQFGDVRSTCWLCIHQILKPENSHNLKSKWRCQNSERPKSTYPYSCWSPTRSQQQVIDISSLERSHSIDSAGSQTPADYQKIQPSWIIIDIINHGTTVHH